MNIRQSRWLTLFVFCVINLFTGSLYAWSVFSGPLATRLSTLSGHPVTPTDLGVIFSIATSVNPFAMIAGGWVNDRFGARAVIPVGGVMIGVGMILASMMESVTGLMLVYGVCFGIGVGLTYTSTISSSIKFFPDRRGLAGGVASMSYGFSSILLPPIASALIVSLGIEKTLLLLGILCGAVIVVGGLLSRRCPDNIEELIFPAGTLTQDSPRSSRHDMNWREMMATPLFWMMLLLFITGSTAALMMISSAATIAQQQIGASLSLAALSVSLLAVMNAAGRIVGGTVSDKIGRIPALLVNLVIAIVGLALLLLSKEGAVMGFIAGLSCVGFCYGGFVGVFPGFTVDQFGAKHNSVNYGIMAAGFSLGGVIGPWLLRLFSQPGHYDHAYWAAMVVSALGFLFAAICVVLIKRQKR